jgi:hypothetical protein
LGATATLIRESDVFLSIAMRLADHAAASECIRENAHFGQILVRVRVRLKRQDGRIEQYEAIYRIIRFTIN